jgi:hypothetical protein
MYKFFLTYGNSRKEVEEPRDFGGVTQRIVRTLNTHGIISDFTTRDMKLAFICNGKAILEAAYYTEGIDATVTLEIEYQADDYTAPEIIYTAEANYKTMLIDADYCEVSFYRDSITTKFLSRDEITTQLNAPEDLDGNPIEPLEPVEVALHSKTIVAHSEYKINEAYITESVEFTGNQSFGAYPFQPTVSGIVGADRPPSLARTVPGIAGRNIFYAGLNGPREIFVDANFVFAARSSGVNAASTRIGFRMWVCHMDDYNSPHNIQGDVLVNIPVAPLSNQGRTSFSQAFSGSVTVPENHILTAEILMFNLLGNYTLIYLEYSEESFLRITENTLTKTGSTVLGYKLFDAINQNLYITTGQKDLLVSPELETGELSNIYITNGFALRTFPDKPIEIDFAEAMNTVSALGCYGYGVELVRGKPKVAIRYMGEFYAGEKILTLNSVTDYTEEVADEYIVNELEIGFKKFADDENAKNTIDDAHTLHEVLTPIEKIKNKKSIISEWIASPYLIEITRRVQYEEEPTKSFKYDSDIFLISTTPGTRVAERNEPFTLLRNIIDPDTTYNAMLTPKHMLLNWGEYLNSFCYYKPFTAEYKPQRVPNNTEMSWQIANTYPFPRGDYQGFSRTVSNYEKIEDVAEGRVMFQPEIVKFTKELCREDLKLITLAHRNALEGLNESKNYGYIEIEKPDGSTIDVFLLELEINIHNRVASFTCIKKGDGRSALNLPGLQQEILGDFFVATETDQIILLG